MSSFTIFACPAILSTSAKSLGFEDTDTEGGYPGFTVTYAYFGKIG
ncbi:hypothetical protein D9758_003084 [Tetrapyrgos nigripes]|uniref:Uncharacterized protein n=1 Tax=Tetrapyrgos nigripes TaxID=182062 RepID=A0A8H5GPH6_9AGAR|nr:hypothetical protein D9758_003084 [Tetrapyrgos nigripes]